MDCQFSRGVHIKGEEPRENGLGEAWKGRMGTMVES